jgi:hypothetical protein
MRRLVKAGALLSAALGATFALSVTAQAATQTARPAVNQGTWVFFGLTYADTSAGLAACNAEGAALVEQVPPSYTKWVCRLNSPDVGSYNLWMLQPGPLP